MRNTTRNLTIGLLALLTLAGTASADGAVGGVDASATTDHASAQAEGFVNSDARYADLDAGAATDEAAGALDTDANVAHPKSIQGGGFFGWIEVRWSTLVAKLDGVFEALGHDAPTTDGAVEAYVSTDGVDLDANVSGVEFDRSPLGEVDGKTWEASATAKGHVATAKGHVPTVG